MIRILLVGKRQQPVVWASVYLNYKHKFKRMRMLDGVARIVKIIYGPIRYNKFPWEKRFNVYNAVYRSDKDAWVKYTERRVLKHAGNVVVDDPHYINEVNYLRNLGFVVIRIDMRNDKKVTIGRALLDSEPETVLLQEYFGSSRPDAYKVDYIISVNSRLQLHEALDKIVHDLKISNSN